jgi:hypothetical protein
VPSSHFAKQEARFAHHSSDHQRAPTDARRGLFSARAAPWKLVPSSHFAKQEARFAHHSSDHQRAPTDACRGLFSARASCCESAAVVIVVRRGKSTARPLLLHPGARDFRRLERAFSDRASRSESAAVVFARRGLFSARGASSKRRPNARRGFGWYRASSAHKIRASSVPQHKSDSRLPMTGVDIHEPGNWR